MSRKCYKTTFSKRYADIGVAMIFPASKIDLVCAFPSSGDSSTDYFSGVFFFTLALFGFSCLSSLGLFANERILFMRERSATTLLSYQLLLKTRLSGPTATTHPSHTSHPRFVHLHYFMKNTFLNSMWQVLFDILPLRLVPPLVFGGILYPLVGLVPTVAGFWKFLLTLVLFNLTTASVVLLLSIAFNSIDVASLVGTLVMLFKYVTSTHVYTKPMLIRVKLTFYWVIDQPRDCPTVPAMAPYHLVLPCCF